MKKVNTVLANAVDSEDVLRAARARRWFAVWPDVVGETLARKSWPDRFSKGTLWVAVDGSAWAAELRLLKGDILTRLAEKCGEPSMFRDVRFGVRCLPARPEPPTVPIQAEQEPDERESMSIREIAQRRLDRWKKE